MYDERKKTWEVMDQSMVKERYLFNLVVVRDELYAVGGDEYPYNNSIEKLDKELGVWRVVAEIDEIRYKCSAVAVGSKIYVLGCVNGGHESTWNAFDVDTGLWESASTSEEKREMPQGFYCGQALTVPPMLPKYT